MLDPPNKTPSTILSERYTMFPRLNWGISVTKRAGRYDDGGGGGKFNENFPIEENEVAAQFRVKGSSTGDGAETSCKISVVNVLKGHSVGTRVERAGRKDGVGERVSKVLVPGK